MIYSKTGSYPANVCFFKVNNENTRTICEICYQLDGNSPCTKQYLITRFAVHSGTGNQHESFGIEIKLVTINASIVEDKFWWKWQKNVMQN